MLARAVRAAEAAGVTRLAEVTGLDCLGVPVFQAIRPWSRALSVHQGKGLTAEAARIGALMEAIESDRAERFVAPWLSAAFADLAPYERAPALDDFAVRRGGGPSESEPLRWVVARRLDGGGPLWVPFDVVSLDFTRAGDERLDRSSDGTGARDTMDGAALKGLLELVERDAVGAWRALPLATRSLRRLDYASIPIPAFQDLASRARSSGLRLAIYHLPAVVPLPVFVAEILEPGPDGAARRATFGSACHPRTEEALLGAVLEAAQSRLTLISAARDDILYTATPACDGYIGLALPLPPGIAPLDWNIVLHQIEVPVDPSVYDISSALVAAGYPGAAVVDLSGPGAEVAVAKAFSPGLGGSVRTRRIGAPAP